MNGNGTPFQFQLNIQECLGDGPEPWVEPWSKTICTFLALSKHYRMLFWHFGASDSFVLSF